MVLTEHPCFHKTLIVERGRKGAVVVVGFTHQSSNFYEKVGIEYKSWLIKKQYSLIDSKCEIANNN